MKENLSDIQFLKLEEERINNKIVIDNALNEYIDIEMEIIK